MHLKSPSYRPYGPIPTGDGATTIDVAGNKFTDGAGTNNSAATQLNWTYDGTAPTMTITSTTAGVTDGSTTNDATIALTFTSSEATTDFAEADITVAGGDLSAFASQSSTVYTATFTPTAEGATTIDVGGSTFTDAVGNNNSAATQFRTAAGACGASSRSLADGSADLPSRAKS